MRTPENRRCYGTKETRHKLHRGVQTNKMYAQPSHKQDVMCIYTYIQTVNIVANDL